MERQMNLEAYYHSSDVLERETADGGFSKGWGMHFSPAESNVLDMHGHVEFQSLAQADEITKRHMELVKPLKINHLAFCTPVMTRPGDEGRTQGFSVVCLSGFEALRPYFELAKRSGALSLMLFLHYENPDVDLLRQSAAAGACAVKLHNAPAIVEAVGPEFWHTPQWAAVFAEIERLGLPVLWHVTQRLTDSPYTGGGRNTYWKDGWKRGATFTNEDLLQSFLAIVERYPRIPFIGAHQLHLGWDRLAELFDRYPNLYVDTSIGCVVNDDDRMSDADADYLRSRIAPYADRVLFGTDTFLTEATKPGASDREKWDTASAHIRFIRQLRLPEPALQQVMHGNAERLFRISGI